MADFKGIRAGQHFGEGQLFASSKQVADKGRNAVSERVGVKVVVEGVVAVVGIEADFNGPRRVRGVQGSHALFAEIALDLKHETANAFFGVPRFESACNPKPKSLRQTGRNPLNVGGQRFGERQA